VVEPAVERVQLAAEAVEPLEHRVELPVLELLAVGHMGDCTQRLTSAITADSLTRTMPQRTTQPTPVRSALTATEVAVLGLLSFGERSGYDLHALVERSVGFFWRPARSQIYALLPRLVARGYAARRDVEQTQRPDKQLYRLTEAGEEALREWLEEPLEWTTVAKDVFQLKLFFSGLGAEDAAEEGIREAKRAAEAHLERLNEIEREVLSPPADEDFFPHLTLKLGRERTKATIRWADEALRELERRRKQRRRS
jgi:DNA-binding PadR family transcriptional regulator